MDDVHSQKKSLSLTELPNDIIFIFFGYLSADSIAKLAQTCRAINSMATKIGWLAYWQRNQQSSFSLSCVESSWSLLEKVRYEVQTKKAWTHREFVARPLLNPWQGKLRPILAISPSRLVVAAGRTLYVYRFSPSQNDNHAPGVVFNFSVTIELVDQAHDGRHDITDITFSPGDASGRTLYAGFADGTVGLVILSDHCLENLSQLNISQRLYTADDVIQSVKISGNSLLSVTSAGTAYLNELESQELPNTLQLRKRTWTAFLSLASSTPYAAFGTSSTTPLALYSIAESQISSKPSTVLQGPITEASRRRINISSAVYDIRGPSASFPSSSNQILVSGWYDGIVRIYDLRVNRRHSRDAGISSASASALSPVLSLSDPWSLEPIYTVASGGGSGTHIAAGSARHSVVAFWDVRNPRAGWSVHAPGNDPSPVYSLLLESSRVFGATQSRAFVYDFGPGVNLDTYPPLVRRRSLKKLETTPGYYVTTYPHK